MSAYFANQVYYGNCWVVETDYFTLDVEYTRILDEDWFHVREIYLSDGDYQVHITNGCEFPVPSSTGSVES